MSNCLNTLLTVAVFRKRASQSSCFCFPRPLAQVVADGKSFIKAQSAAQAALKDGLEQRALRDLGNIACSGKHPGNAARDFTRLSKRRWGKEILEPYYIDIPFRDGKTNQMSTRQHPIFLPHEIYSYMGKRPDTFTDRIFGRGNSAADWWSACGEEEWFINHPAKRFLDVGCKVTPIRLYGDDVSHHRDQSILVLSWSPAHLQHLQTLLSRYLITVLPLGDADAVTHTVIYKYVTWSMEVLLTGRWPPLDPHGKPWPKTSFRRRLGEQGADLDPKHKSRGALAQLAGDWKFIREALHFHSHHYNARKACHLCGAVKFGVGPPAYHFEENSAWMGTTYTFAEYLADILRHGDEPSALTRIPGFCFALIMVDLMHVLHLGVLLWALGSQLYIMAERGAFGHFHGPRVSRLNEAMSAAYAMFVKYCRDRKILHSQTRFTAAKIGRGENSEDTFPCLKAKAANARHITQWLYSALPDDTPALERTLFWGLCECLHLLHSARGPSFSDVDKSRFVFAGRASLKSYAELTRGAKRAKLPLWPLKPKFHLLAHEIHHVYLTGRVPGWCFADEDFNRLIVRTCRFCTYNPSVGKRALLLWSIRLHRTFEEDSAGVLSDSSDSDG